MTNLLTIGKLTTSFGIKGGIKVHSFSGEVDHFLLLKGKMVQLVGANGQYSLEVVNVELKGETPVIYLQGYNSPETVSVLRGCEVFVERQYAAPLDSDEYYIADLMGLAVISKNQKIGVIVGFMEGAQILLELELLDKRHVFIPFVKHYIGDVDLQTSYIELLDDGLISENL